MGIKEKPMALLRSSAVLYLLAAIVMLTGVNGKAMAVNYSQHLFTKFYNGGFRNQLDGAHYFESYVRLNPQDPQGYMNLGVCYYRLGEERKAVAAYQKAELLKARQGMRQPASSPSSP